MNQINLNNKEYDVIIVGAGFDLTEEQLEKIIKQNEKELNIVNVDPINKPVTIASAGSVKYSIATKRS